MKLKGSLNSNDINNFVIRSERELERMGIASEQCLRFKLAFEEILIMYREISGEDTPCLIKIRKGGGNLYINLFVNGEKSNPYKLDSPLLDRVTEGFEIRPEWKYENNTNIIEFLFIIHNSPGRNFAFGWRYLKKHRVMLIISIAMQLISIILGILGPVLTARIMVYYMDEQVYQVIGVAISLLIIQLIKNLLMISANMGYNRVYCSTLSELESDLVMGALTIKNKCMEENGSGLFIQRLTVDTSRMAMGFGRIADMLAQAINYIGILLAMLAICPPAFLLTLVLLVVQSFMEIYRTRCLCRDDRIYRSANEKFSGLVGEMVRGAKDVKQLSSEDSFSKEAEKRVVNANDKRLALQKHSWRLKLLRWEVSELGTFAFIILMAMAIGWGYLPAATVLILYNYYSNLDGRAVSLAGEFLEFVKDFSLSVERVCALMTSPEFPKEQFGTRNLSSPKGEITFEHVTFGYKGSNPTVSYKTVLKDMSFTIKPGEMVALVGKSGCGKSTVLNLLCRLYDPDSGRILFDGEEVQTLTKEALRDNMTMVSQSPYIFNMTVRENLKIAKKEITDEEMKRVCALACIDEDIEAMPEKYDSVIGEGGVNLSGGQRQRLAIARGLLKDYKVILFDEATSALDNITQAKIQKAIESIGENRTIILIAHRLSTVIHADRIMYMDDGRIIASGTHEELLENCDQ
ncbi:MAG: ABC transporter ATP-binding protein/permease, partial [Eubacterium sp.]|nr:ABC transporter ATP-binding protein/permease [Eubacterium sp.]